MASLDEHSSSEGRRLVFVTLGTIHYPFDRLVRWMDAWATGPVGQSARCLIQRGTSVAPLATESVELLEFPRLQELLASATTIVAHGSASSIAHARRAGKKPIIVPRRPDLGEHVDSHQVAYANLAQRTGRAAVADDQEALHSLLDEAISNPEAFRVDPAPELRATEATIARFAELVDPLLSPPE